MTTTLQRPAEPEVDDARGIHARRTLLSIIAVCALIIAGAGGWLLRGSSSTAAAMPGASSVDAGFARDMATHHTQAVIMAGYERDNTTDPQLKLLAFDMETSQQYQVGQMQGWLDSWELPATSAHPMSWMGSAMGMGTMTAMTSTSLMPGMATPAQMTKLETLHGKALDVMFLQLMIHHHQGGLPMARYAAMHATEPYVRRMAGAIVANQSAELVQMEQKLRSLGGSPLPPPS